MLSLQTLSHSHSGERRRTAVRAAQGQWKQISNQYFYMPWGGKDFSLFVETESGTSSFYIDQAVGAKQGTYIQGAN